MAHPLPPWPRRLVPEVFRCRLAQIRAFGRCKCAPSVLSPHLAVRWRRLSLTTCPVGFHAPASLHVHSCFRTRYDIPSWGSSPLRCIDAEASRDVAVARTISSQRIPIRCAVRMSRLPRPLRSCGTFRVRRLPVRPLRALPRHLPGLFHPGNIHGVLPFRGLTSH